jgi:glutamate dehydrogenase
MTKTVEQKKAELIEHVAGCVRARLGAGEEAGAERFARQFFTNVPPEALLEDTSDNLCGAVLAFWQFTGMRAPGAPKIRVYGPGSQEVGWDSVHTVVEIVNDDMPFLVDSVTGELIRLGAEIFLVVHPVVRVERDASGRLTALHGKGEGPPEARDESLMHLRISAQSEERQEEIRRRLAKVLADVRAAVEDWGAMRKRCRQIIEELRQSPPRLPKKEISEGIAFLDWIEEHYFTFMGYREYSFEGSGEGAVARVLPGGLGVLRDEQVVVFDGLRNLGRLPEDVRHFLHQPELLLITKANRTSTVHRQVQMDAIAVKIFDTEGRVAGERVFIGLFTSAAYSQSSSRIPILRQKVKSSFERAGFAPASHNGKALANILESYPRDELFQMSGDDLLRIAKGVLYLLQRPRIALFVRRDPFERFVSCLVLVPVERYDTDLRGRFEKILAEAYQGEVTLRHSQLRDDFALAWLLYGVETAPGQGAAVDPAEVEAKLIEAGRTWEDRLEETLAASLGEEEGGRAARRFGRAFPGGYRDRFRPEDALADVARIEAAIGSGDLVVSLYRADDAPLTEMRFKIYGTGPKVPLSDLLPMLESMGLKVIDEIPYELSLAGFERPAWIRDFNMTVAARPVLDPIDLRETFEEAFTAVWRGELENDGFNKLVLSAGLTAREVTVLRTYSRYLRQAQIPFSQAYMEETLAHNSGIASLLVDLFQARFDPALQENAEVRAQTTVEEIARGLESVTDADQDRILRRFLNLIESTLRTNYFQTGADGRPKPYLSVKLDSLRVDDLPLPRPLIEVFVYSPRVEAVHLRGGKVARGGIRWSDRREDFRTEVLGLMKAQMVKNAVIVPVGSKGGFVVKRPPATRDKQLQEGIECYKTMMRGLLDLTDNLKGDTLVPPPDVVRRDPPDPYLVVAADKGTARFSDIANAVSAEYGFWLDDAFASGGSAGYDHKAMAITSRGLWESVKRHFREIETGNVATDVQNEDFTVAGVGDMSGDVFGNGMLRSRHIRLVAAFDHRHFFIDPDPDAVRSFDERKRLFELPQSSWADYDPALISPGGGVFERSARSIPVSPQMAERFGIQADHIAPAELAQALLTATVDLLFFGGIGTYVKASTESHADASDRANDAVRVDGAALRARVIGEGANLGMTQRGRIEYALRGGRLNTDFIDNSAGVDCSDHEVNIKILLNEVEREGKLTRQQRNEKLASMTDEVADLVLRDNYLQTQALTVTYALGGHLLDRLARFMKTLEKEKRLSRRIEFLPDDEELEARAQRKLGFTRPELAVLLSNAKIALYDELLASDLPDDPFMQEDLKLYFPTPLREAFAEQISRHRLRREIISTSVTNSVINRAGIGFVHEMKERTGESAADIARAYVITRDIFRLRSLWQEIEALDNRVPASLQAAMLAECGRMIDRGTTWFLREGDRPLDIGAQIAAYAPSVAEISSNLGELMSAAERARFDQKVQSYIRVGEPLARRVACLVSWLGPALDIVHIARKTGLPPLRVGRIYFGIGERFGFDRLRQTAALLPTDKAWDKLAVSAVLDDLNGHQSELTARVLASVEDGIPAEQAIEAWAERRRPVVARTEQLLAEMQSATGTPDLAMLAVANRQLKSLGT